MYYWNQDNFEGLEGIANQAVALPHLENFSRYCILRSNGLRKDALSALKAFLNGATSLSFDERRKIVVWLLETQLRAPRVHQLLPHPVTRELIEPTLVEWIRLFPMEASAHRWRGYVSRNIDALKRAVEIDAGDSIARGLLISQLISEVDFATHHLAEGSFIGEVTEAMATLEDIRHLLTELPAGTKRTELESCFNEQHQLVHDWVEYKSNPIGSFQEWCLLRQRPYHWPSIVYYNK
ncbi:MAG: hypothetical protein V4488_16710 [Pseudomonadota bacterium]